ncbi:MAG: phosphoribosyltransferase [Deltaproteobacteria bacterium]|nr:phosphoribosyltransferase [Deltaproteobacteria bacterium]
MGRLIDDPHLRHRTGVFPDRERAGALLAEKLLALEAEHPLLFAIPAGGVPVAVPIARRLDIPLELVIVRKIQLPWTTEAGFGALDPDGRAIFNEELMARLHLSPAAVEAQTAKTLASLKAREDRLRGGRPYPELDGRAAIVVDDGLASGYTMRAGAAFLKRRGAGGVIIAVPTGCQATVGGLLPEVDTLVCLNVRGGYTFAVADAYEYWYDVSPEEVLELLASLPPRRN